MGREPCYVGALDEAGSEDAGESGLRASCGSAGRKRWRVGGTDDGNFFRIPIAIVPLADVAGPIGYRKFHGIISHGENSFLIANGGGENVNASVLPFRQIYFLSVRGDGVWFSGRGAG